MSDEHSIPSSPVKLPTPRRKRWRGVLLGVVILVCGIVIGAGGTVIVVHRALSHAIHHPEEASERASQRLRRKLDLTEEQTARVKSIIAARQQKIQALRRQWQPLVEDELLGLREDVAAVLEPEKAKRWRERFNGLRDRWIPRLPPPEKR
jgi:hypothetical protein